MSPKHRLTVQNHTDRPAGRGRITLAGAARPAILLLIAALFLPSACGVAPQRRPDVGLSSPGASPPSAAVQSSATAVETAPTAPSVHPERGSRASVVCVGDVLFHSAMIAGGEQADGSYDYDFLFDRVKPFIEAADLALCDMEGTLAGPPYTGYPLFSAPDAVARAMAVGGFDIVTNMNNHTIDSHAEGVIRTHQVLSDQGLTVIGTRPDTDGRTWSIRTVNGIRIGFGAWSYETVRVDGRRMLNGITISDEALPLVESFSQEESYFEADMERLAAQVAEIRAAGADSVVYFIHAGTEYDSEPNDWQRGVAQTLADAGCDVVFSCGPHVIQPVETVARAGGGNPMLCFYSVGNFVSDQLYDTDNNGGRAEDGLIGMVQFERQADGSVALSDAGYLTTYCHKRYEGDGRTKNQPVPVEKGLEDPEAFDAGEIAGLLAASKERSQTVMAQNRVSYDFFRELFWTSDLNRPASGTAASDTGA